MNKPLSFTQFFSIIISIIVLSVIIWFVVIHKGELESTFFALESGQWLWLVAAGLFEVFYFLIVSQYYHRTLKVVGVQLSARAILPILIGTQTVGVFIPSEFLASQSLFLYLARKQQQSLTQIALGTILTQVLEFVSFSFILIVGLLVLMANHTIQHFEIVASYILLAVVFGCAAVAFFIIVHPERFIGFMTALQRMWNAICRLFSIRASLKTEWIHRFSHEFNQGIMTARENSRELFTVLMLTLVAHIMRIICLWCVFGAFGLPISVSNSITAYAIGTLAWTISPLPQGIGLVEGTYGLVLISFGIAPAAATTVALTYRGFVFWLPFFIGIFTLRKVRATHFVTIPSDSQ